MGRRAKYHTADQRREAASAARSRYAQSSRGKEIRSQQNRRQYLKTRSSATSCKLKLPAIPYNLRELASLPLPLSSRRFQYTFHGTEEITGDDDFAHWENTPPYSVSPHLVNYGLEETIEFVHGRRARIHKENDIARIQLYNTMRYEDFQAKVHSEIMSGIASWKSLKDLLKHFRQSHLDQTMGRHLLQWRARCVMALVEDFKALKNGQENDRYLILFTDRWASPMWR